jgi:hypothetical protein
MHNKNDWLSEISCEIAFMLQIMRNNKQKADFILEQVVEKIENEPII